MRKTIDQVSGLGFSEYVGPTKRPEMKQIIRALVSARNQLQQPQFGHAEPC